MEQLANFQYKIVHRPGKLHADADGMFRLPGFREECQTAENLGGRVDLLPASSPVIYVAPEGGRWAVPARAQRGMK